jgi:hypothetical protein
VAGLTHADRQAAARETVELLVAADWASVSDRCVPAMRDLVEGRKGADHVWRKASRGRGAYSGVTAALYTPEDDANFQADFTLGFDRGSLRVRLALDDEGRITGLLVRPGDWS